MYLDSASEVSRLKINIEKMSEVLTEKEKHIEDLEKQLHTATLKTSVSYVRYAEMCFIML